MSIADLRAKLGYSEGEMITQPEPRKPVADRPRVILRGERRLCEVTSREQSATS